VTTNQATAAVRGTAKKMRSRLTEIVRIVGVTNIAEVTAANSQARLITAADARANGASAAIVVARATVDSAMNGTVAVAMDV